MSVHHISGDVYHQVGHMESLQSPDCAAEGLGAAIRARVKEKGTTLERASVDLGLQANALCRWSTGTEPTASNYTELMTFLGVGRRELGGLIIEDQWHKFLRRLPPT